MKITYLSALLTLSILSCTNENKKLQSQIDSLQVQLNKTYKPGFGEFMSSIQVHHEKLWFAGQNKNWKLADFEIHELEEALQGIQEYCKDRPETKSIAMINAVIDSVQKTIQQKNILAFNNSFIALTNTCNECHQATQHEFNLIQLPTTPPFSNQTFKEKNSLHI